MKTIKRAIGVLLIVGIAIGGGLIATDGHWYGIWEGPVFVIGWVIAMLLFYALLDLLKWLFSSK